MENKGIELGIQYTNSVNSGSLSGLNYTAGFNLDHYKNKLVKFGEREIPGYILREEGYEWEAYYMVKQIGIFQTEEEIANAPPQYNDATVPGDLKYLDADGDGDVDNDDRTYIPGKYPKLNYAGNFGVNWKGFDLSGQIQGVYGVKYYVNLWGTVPFIHGAPPTTDWLDRWTETNPSTTQPRMYWSYSTARIWRTCSWYLQDASYVRLKNLTFGYTLPVSLTQHIGIDQLRVYFSGDNLITLTDYPGLDPERASSGNYAIYPQNRIYSFGLNVKF